jgi:AhpD family alkylhydroperoxidase
MGVLDDSEIHEEGGMARLVQVEPEQAGGKGKELLESVQGRSGHVTNMLKTMASSPATLEGYLGLARALKRGTLPVKLREGIALYMAERHRCEYCIASHVQGAQKVGLSEEDVLAARQGQMSDAKLDAGLQFARAVLENRGQVSNEEVQRVREAGYGDGEISELVAQVALNTLTNYYNMVAQTTLDFPKVSFLTEQEVAQ